MQLLFNHSTDPELLYFPGLFGDTPIKIYNSIQIGPLTITFYGLLISFGLLLALIYGFKVFRKVGVDPDKAIDAILGGIIGGIVGARLYYVIFSWDSYGLDFSSGSAFWESFSRIFKTWEGGMAIYGGLIGALLVGVLIAKWRKICIPAILDVAGVGFLLGQGIGRWGNFFNVEAFGDNTSLPWGMWSSRIQSYLMMEQESLAQIGIAVDPAQPVHPCFLYESLWCILGFILLALYMKHRKFDGEVFLMYLAFYGAERFVVEGLRTDSLMIGSLRVSQLLALVLVIVSIIIILVIRSKIKGAHDENYKKLYVLTEPGQRILNGLSSEEKKAAKENRLEKPAGEGSEGDTTPETDGIPENEENTTAEENEDGTDH